MTSCTSLSVSRLAVPLPMATRLTWCLAARRAMVDMRAVPVAARLVRVDGGVVEHLAGGVDDGDLAAGADAGVEAHGDVLAGRGGEQQVLQVAAEDADGFFLGAFAQLVHQFEFEVGENLDLPGPAHGVGQPFVGRAALRLDAETDGDALLAGVWRAGLDGFRVEFGVEHQRHLQHAFVAAAQQGQGAVRGHASRSARRSRTSRGTWRLRFPCLRRRSSGRGRVR